MKNIFLIRHCSAKGQEPTAELTDEGREQAVRLAEVLVDKQIEVVVSSPYQRAIATIRPFCERHHLTLQTDERLKERVLSSENHNDWMEKLKTTYMDLDLKYEGGESSNEAMSRGIAVIHDLLDRPEQNIALVTHGALLSLILKLFDSSIGFEEWKDLKNPDIYHIKFDKSFAELNRIFL